MNTKIILTLCMGVCCLLLANCASPFTPSVPEGYSVKTIKRGFVKLDYEDRQTLFKKERERGESLMKTTAEIQKAMRYKPKGGYVKLTIYGYTISSANPKYWHILLIDPNGKLVSRTAGQDDIANLPNQGDLWWNIMLARVSEPIEDSLTVRILVFGKVEAEYAITRTR